MGTSASSTGPASGISMDPPWLDDINSDTNVDTAEDNDTPNSNETVEIAPRARFRSARKNFNDFARTGSQDSFKKAAGYYSKNGMGGASNVSKRMRASTKSVAGLVSFLRDVKNNVLSDIREWAENLISKSPTINEVRDAIIDRVTNEGGVLDEESIKNSMADSISDLYEENPDLNLFNLSDDEIWDLVENFLSYEASNRLQIDIGQSFESKITPVEMVQRTEEMHEYLKAEISNQLQRYKSADKHPDINKLDAIMRQALENTFLVFEGEI